jgi:DNA polymerase III delta subunit
MIIVLEGPDSYRRLQKALEIRAVYKKKHPYAVVYEYDLENDEDRVGIREQIGTQSLFAASKVIHIKNYTDGVDNKTTVFLKKIVKSSSMVVILESEKKAPKWLVELAQLPERTVRIQEFSFLEGTAWFRYVQKTAEDMGVILDRDTVEYIAEINQKNTWKLIQDVAKLALSTNKVITKKEYERICAIESPHDFFSLVMAMHTKQQNKKIRSVELLIRKGNDPAKIFNIVAVLARDNIKTYAQLDILIKSGRIDYDDALLALAIA